VQTILPMVLIGVLGAAVLGLSALGLRQHFRAAALARWAHESGMHFSAEDTFELPRRCAAFALCSAGHSAQARNVTYGRLKGLPVRAFDFRYEVGHGTRRAARHYHVVLVEEGVSPGVLMWNRRDAASAPPAARVSQGEAADWSFRGDSGQARRLGDLCLPLAGGGVSIEARADGLMLCFPTQRRGGEEAGPLEKAAQLVGSLWPAERASKPSEKGEAQTVANRPRA
jgi:hypothetical protein